MYRAYKFRMYPNDKQKEIIHKTFGCCRLVYNHYLDVCKKEGYQKAYDMCKNLKDLEKEYPFLKEVDSCSLRGSIFALEASYQNFFAKRSEYPRFKNKFSKQSYRTTCIRSTYKGRVYSNIEIDLGKRKIKLPKLGLVEIRGYRNLESIEGKIISGTVLLEKTGKYYVSVMVEEEKKLKEKKEPNSIVGIDLGIKDLVVTSDGKKYTNPKELAKKEKQLKRYQRKLSRKVKGSSNYYKTKIKIARLHSKIKNSRKYNLIKIVNELVEEHDIIVSERLQITKMSKNHNLAKAILDASFHKICELLKWKTTLQGKYYYQVDSYYPSSKICSHCGNKTEITNNLSIRNWECERCGNLNDRDRNASINIMFEGLRRHYQS